VAGAVAVRVAVMLNGLGRLDDPDNYLGLARSMAGGHGFALAGRLTAYRPPLYPIVLVPLVGILPGPVLPWGVGALHLALGAGMVVLVHRTARRWGLSPGRALVASGLVGFDPVLVAQSRSVMTETPAAFLVAATLAGLSVPGARGAVLGGLGFGLSSLCRPSLLPGAGLAALAGLMFGPGGVKARLGRSMILVAATVATLAPWTWRNIRVFGEPVATTTHGGYTLALANNPVYLADVLDGPPGAVWSGPNQQAWFDEVARSTAGMTEPEADRALRDRAWSFARERPGGFLRASLARLGRFWGLAPAGAVYPGRLRAATAAWTLPLWVALAAGLARPGLWRWPSVAAPAIVMSLSMVHLAYWTDLRMRAPVLPAIAMIAAGFPAPRWPRSGRAWAPPRGSERTASKVEKIRIFQWCEIRALD